MAVMQVTLGNPTIWMYTGLTLLFFSNQQDTLFYSKLYSVLLSKIITCSTENVFTADSHCIIVSSIVWIYTWYIYQKLCFYIEIFVAFVDIFKVKNHFTV